ncbi:START domain-containing protein [Endozoicomonas sp. ALE010]|uniref:START domain-containing protein n=1 Tax=Endozoicomonas sp. ALE010 TaxID=3403081 RepID=UPI003BB5E393
MRACQGNPQFDEYSSRSISRPGSQRQIDVGTWHTNSVSVEENVAHSIQALPEGGKQESATTSAKKPLEDRQISPGFQVTHSPDGNAARCPVTPVFVESKGQRYKLMQLPDFVKLRDFAGSQDGKWTKVYEDSQKALLVESRPEDLKPGEKGSGFNIVRATVQWDDINPETLFNTLHDADYRKTWDKKMVEGRDICQLDYRNDIGYYAVQPPWPISKRDFCNMRSWMEFTNGEYIIMNHSVDHADCPEREGFVRARSFITGYYMIPTHCGGTKLIFISHSDPKGSIPAWLVNNLLGKVIPDTITNLHDCALKYDTWASENHGSDTKYKWRTPKIDWNDFTREVQDNYDD